MFDFDLFPELPPPPKPKRLLTPEEHERKIAEETQRAIEQDKKAIHGDFAKLLGPRHHTYPY